LAQASFHVQGHYHVQVGSGWLSIGKDGEFTAESHGATATSTVDFISRDGHPAISPAGCSANLGDFSVEFHGDLIDDIINLFRGAIADYLKGHLEPVLCQEVNSIEATEANAALAQIPIEIELPGEGRGFHISYGLTSNPTATDQFIAIPIQGKFWYDGHENDPQIPAPSGVTPLNNNEMVCFEFDAGEVLGSGIYALEVSPFSHIVIDQSLLSSFPQTIRDFFQCACPDNPPCMGMIMPVIQQYCPPGGFVEIVAAVDQSAAIAVNSSGAYIGISGTGTYRAHLADGQFTNLFDVSASLGMELLSDLHIDDWTIKGRVSLYDETFTPGTSYIGPIDLTSMQSIWDYAMHIVTDQMLNAVLSNGIPLPAIPYVNPINPRFIFTDHELIFCSDLQAHSSKKGKI
jgi:hypothetical protein